MAAVGSLSNAVAMVLRETHYLLLKAYDLFIYGSNAEMRRILMGLLSLYLLALTVTHIAKTIYRSFFALLKLLVLVLTLRVAYNGYNQAFNATSEASGTSAGAGAGAYSSSGVGSKLPINSNASDSAGVISTITIPGSDSGDQADGDNGFLPARQNGLGLVGRLFNSVQEFKVDSKGLVLKARRTDSPQLEADSADRAVINHPSKIVIPRSVSGNQANDENFLFVSFIGKTFSGLVKQFYNSLQDFRLDSTGLDLKFQWADYGQADGLIDKSTAEPIIEKLDSM